MSGQTINKYYDPDLTAKALSRGQHRTWIGGMWDEIGQLQFDFLKSKGLRPEDRVLDLGCGCFRAGVHLIRYLEVAHYYGIDISQELLDTGYQRELVPLGLDQRLPQANLLCSDDFEAEKFATPFDLAIAQSVFTHLSFNHLRQCLARLAPAMKDNGTLYLTAFICPPAQDSTRAIKHDPGGIVTSPVKDPFHYQLSDFEYAAKGLPWRVEVIGDWNHPRNQSMIAFHRVDSDNNTQ